MNHETSPAPMDGVIVVDKPAGWTSHDVVGKMRRLAETRKIGHLGTLDPMATGVLPLVIGRATRLAQFYTRSDKIYDAVIRFGYATTTYDAEGEVVGEQRDAAPDREQVIAGLAAFRGLIMQTPPPVSAKKIGGVPAYKLARKNIEVNLQPVEVHIYSIEILDWPESAVRLKVHCSGGTYLRSIAHDLGAALGCGAHLSDLRRLASGDFTIEQARTIDELTQMKDESRLRDALVPAARLLPQFPTETVDAVTVAQIRQGRDFRVSPFRVDKAAKLVKAVSQHGDLVAIGEQRLPNLYHPILVL